MSTRTTSILVMFMIMLAIVAGMVLWAQLPEQMASHWDANDQVNGYMPKVWGVWMMPLVTLGMLALFLTIPNIDPLKANIEQFRGVFNLFILFISAFMLYMHGLTLAWNIGFQFRMSSAMLPFMGILFIFMGYLLKQAKRNFFIGIRTPWTLSSDTVWDKTHQLGSVLFIASGVLSIAGSFFGGMTALWLTLFPLLGSTLILVLYSYVLYQRESKA